MRAGRWEGNHRVSLSLCRQSACWERRRAGLLNYLVVWRDPSSEAERREHFVTERKKDKKSKGEEGKETLEELSDWILEHKAKEMSADRLRSDYFLTSL